MAFIGLLLLAAAAAVAAGIIMDNTDPSHITAFGQAVPGIHNEWQVFLAGAAVAVVFVVGAMLTFAGAGRLLRARRDLRYLREEHEESLTTLEMEKRRLQRELARVRQNGGAAAPPLPRQAPAPAPTPAPAQAGPAARGSQVSARSPFFDRAD
ncbi:hypothetical protein [Actinomadura violacea]|uniref:LapA family protein n=1 Tax=Actinomadura violacea TaxID=2819934 RepID=A0ABS3SBB1_9ACTN|nr:hypothetical protein [Actinomadura violacea]MBO2466176.1 hypothetical protein [Actinomadura violacea]